MEAYKTIEAIGVMIDDYAFENKKGEKTIALHYYGMLPFVPTPYAVVGNKGVCLWWVKPEELALFVEYCLRNEIIIDTIK